MQISVIFLSFLASLVAAGCFPSKMGCSKGGDPDFELKDPNQGAFPLKNAPPGYPKEWLQGSAIVSSDRTPNHGE